jgi:hypothetical protein
VHLRGRHRCASLHDATYSCSAAPDSMIASLDSYLSAALECRMARQAAVVACAHAAYIIGCIWWLEAIHNLCCTCQPKFASQLAAARFIEFINIFTSSCQCKASILLPAVLLAEQTTGPLWSPTSMRQAATAHPYCRE